jgi:hypothetical protein
LSLNFFRSKRDFKPDKGLKYKKFGHKDRVSFNPFPLKNDHLDRVSFLLNQTGHLGPSQGPPQLGVSCFDYKCIEEQEWERRRHDCKKPSNKSDKYHTDHPLSLKSLITNDHLSQLWNLERLEALIVSWNGLLALVVLR